uniref:NADH-ubiquinone oxidoreductase chain 1 n=1 Tax=Diapriidae sp. ZJUH_2016010 TaxID=2491155 RepID=A0A3S8V0L1_9HYME|nr:NADH dehydrogenase subunit 1 [Diapriidae sp. ZJUH_2016010]
MYLMNFLNNYIILLILLNLMMVMLCIGFFTLLERKILSYINLRKGPNKVGFLGIFQPFSDAMKLFLKEFNLINKSNYYIYMFSPIFLIFIMLMIWLLIPFKIYMISMNFNILNLLCFMGLSVYFLMFSGWSSNSMYSLLGSIRSISQIISYEVSLILIMLSLIYMTEEYNFFMLIYYQEFMWFMMMMYLLGLIFFVSIMAELNRTPFDLVEGESELVSGFNVDYMSSGFVLIFIYEYGMMIFMMFMYLMFFFATNYFYLFYYFKLLIFMNLIIWIRGTLPRIRYDKLMLLVWKSYLLISLNYLLLNLFFKKIFIMLMIYYFM